jgi:hypothetical protein
MPFKSEAQRRKFHAMAARGEISESKVREWEHETPNKDSLPYRVKSASLFVPTHISAGLSFKTIGRSHGKHALHSAKKRMRKAMNKESGAIELITLNSFVNELEKISSNYFPSPVSASVSARRAVRARVAAAARAAEEKRKALEAASRAKYKNAPGDLEVDRLNRRRDRAAARGSTTNPAPQPAQNAPNTKPPEPPKPTAATQPAANKPASTQPAANKPASTQPADTQSAGKQSEPSTSGSSMSSAAKWGLGGLAAGVATGVIGTKMLEKKLKRNDESSLDKTSMPFLKQDRPAKVKEIYKALKRDHPNMPAEVKARIAARKGKKSPESRKPPETGGPAYKAPLHYEYKDGKYKAAMYRAIQNLKRSLGEVYW